MTRLPILVAYDGSADADRALMWAAAESARTADPVLALVVREVPPPGWSGVGGTFVVTDGLVQDTIEVRDRAEKRLADLGVGEATVEMRTGHVVTELLRAAHAASMVVLGSRGHSAVGEVVLGSVSQHVARHARCPVVVVRPQHEPSSERIVVGVDGSPTSVHALAYACARAERTGETVVAVHAWHVHVPSTDVWSGEARDINPEGRRLLLAEAAAGLREKHPDVRLELEAVPVEPVQCLVDASAGASLVVVGSHGHGFFSGLLLGSVSQDVLRRAQCPVLVVR